MLIISLPAELPVGSIVAKKGYDLAVANNDSTRPVSVWVRKPSHPNDNAPEYCWADIASSFSMFSWRQLLDQQGELEVLYVPDSPREQFVEDTAVAGAGTHV